MIFTNRADTTPLVPKLFASGWFLPGILLISALTRWIASDLRGLTYDDTFSYFLSAQPFAEIVRGTAADTMPPLYYFLLHLWMEIGTGVWWLRSLNILLSIATVALLYIWIRELAGSSAAGWAALIAAVSPLHVYHAQDLRMYAPLALAQLGYAYCSSRLIIHGESRMRLIGWGGLVASGSLALYTHNLAGVVLVVPNLILLWQRRWSDLLRLVAAQVVIGVVALPWLVQIPGQIAKIQKAFGIPRPGPVELVQSAVQFHSYLPLPGIWVAVAVFFSLQAVALVIFELIRANRTGADIQGTGLLLAFLLVPPAILFILSYLMRPIYVTRAIFYCTLPYFGLAGIALSRIRVMPVRVYLTGCFVILALMGLISIYTFSDFPRSPFKAMTAAMRTTDGEERLVLHDNKLSYFPAHYYAPDLPQAFLADEPDSPNDTLALASQAAMQIFPLADLAEGTAGKEQIDYVIFQQALVEYQARGEEPSALVWLRGRYSSGSPQAYGDLWVFPFYARATQ